MDEQQFRIDSQRETIKELEQKLSIALRDVGQLKKQLDECEHNYKVWKLRAEVAEGSLNR
jgi:hypothetical protein